MVEEDGSLELGKASACDAGDATFAEPWFPSSVIALKKEDRVGVVAGCLHFSVVEVATKHCEELSWILQWVDTDEQGVVPCLYVMDSGWLHCGGSFKVPPELGFHAVSSHSSEAGFTVCNAVWDPGYQVCYRAQLGGVAGWQDVFDES